jgi:hypothetical protein
MGKSAGGISLILGFNVKLGIVQFKQPAGTYRCHPQPLAETDRSYPCLPTESALTTEGFYWEKHLPALAIEALNHINPENAGNPDATRLKAACNFCEQLTNILLSYNDLRSGSVTLRWREFMRFQIDRVVKLYRSTRPGISMLDADGRFAIAAAADLYQGILDNIKAHVYDVFNFGHIYTRRRN